MVMFYVLFEAALVNYIMSDSLSPTTHSGDVTLMRFRVFTWRFRTPSSQVALWWPRDDNLGGVKRHTGQLRRVSHIVVNHTFSRHFTHEISYRVRVYKREFERFSDAYFCTNTHGMEVVVWQNMCGVPLWSVIWDMSMIEEFWWKLRV
jgi:hypothetical protein